jgi:glycosyltransferase involved in cell wall biosynthesis
MNTMSNVVRPLVSIVLGTYNRQAFLESTVASVRASQFKDPYEIIVVDGGSNDGTLDWLVAQRDIIAVVQHNRETIGGVNRRKRSWGYFMNLGFKCAEGRYLCLISDDSVVHPDTIANGVSHFDRELAQGRRLGALAFYWRSWPEEAQYRVCRTLSDHLMVNHGLFLREAVEEVGWIEEELYSFYCADGDLSLKLWQAGYEVDACEAALVEHFERAGTRLREANLSSAAKDWDNYTARWSGTYFDSEKPYPGRWVALEGLLGRQAHHLFPDEARLKMSGDSAQSPSDRVRNWARRLLARRTVA